MKIACACGLWISDNGDAHPHKAHLIPDQAWESVLDAIRDAIDSAGETPESRRAAWARAITALGNASRLAWQCIECGRIVVDDADHRAFGFAPIDPSTPTELFRRRPTPGD